MVASLGSQRTCRVRKIQTADYGHATHSGRKVASVAQRSQDEFLGDASADDRDASQTKLKETVYDERSCRTLYANLYPRHPVGTDCSSFPALPAARRRSNRSEQEC